MRASKRRFFNCRQNPRLSLRLKPNGGQPTSTDTSQEDSTRSVDYTREHDVAFKAGSAARGIAAIEEMMEMTMPAVTKIREDKTTPKKERMLIGGKWVDSVSGEWLEVEDPAHRRPIAEVPRGRSEDVARAVKAAADAFPAWSRTVPRERGRLLARIADALEARVEELARTIALETGNAL